MSGKEITVALSHPLLAAAPLPPPGVSGLVPGASSTPGRKLDLSWPQELPLAPRELFPNTRDALELQREGPVRYMPRDYILITSA